MCTFGVTLKSTEHLYTASLTILLSCDNINPKQMQPLISIHKQIIQTGSQRNNETVCCSSPLIRKLNKQINVLPVDLLKRCVLWTRGKLNWYLTIKHSKTLNYELTRIIHYLKCMNLFLRDTYARLCLTTLHIIHMEKL